MSSLRGIYGIVDDVAVKAPLELADALLAGGVRVVQYRAKRGVDRGLLRALVGRVRAAGGILVVNDDLEAALEADGWHAGQEDLVGRDLAEIRGRLGSRLLGISAGVPSEARLAEAAGADYVGVGPFAATGSKPDAGEAIGTAGIADVVRSTSLPVVAIGGIALSSLPDVVRSGASMAAVISAFALAPDPEEAVRTFVGRWRELTA